MPLSDSHRPRWGAVTASMGLAPFGDLDGVHLFALWAHNEMHSAFPSHQATRQTERVFFRGARSSDDVPIQSLIKIVRCPTHASTIAGSVPDAEGRRPDSARPVQRGDRHEDQQAPRVVEQQPDGGEGRGHLASGLPIVVASTPYDRAMSARGSPASRRLRAS